jgi:hypothetical protein
VITKKQFRQYFDSLDPEKKLGNSISPLWEPERHWKVNTRWYVCIKPILYEDRDEYNTWVRKHCTGSVLCFSSNDENQEEWYGFTHYADIMFWLLRWS